MPTLTLTNDQYDVVLAATRLLATEIEAGRVTPDDGDIGTIMTCDGEHAAMTPEEIHDMADGWQMSPVVGGPSPLARLIAAATAYNDALNKAERAPTGDEYNELLDLILDAKEG